VRVTVLGAGSWGTTVASICSRHHPTVLWARDPDLAKQIDEEHLNLRYLADFPLPEDLRSTADLAEAAGHADLLVVGVPSHGFRAVLEEAAPHVRPWVPVVSIAKGLEEGSLLRMTEVAARTLPGRPTAALSGPNLAKEIMAGYAAATVLATDDPGVAEALQRVFDVGLFRVYTNHDVLGVEVGGAVKNVIAIAAGVGEGLGVGDNSRAAVMARGLAELTRLGVAMGGEPATFAGLAGLGDLLATCMSPQSRNRFVGLELGRGRQLADILAGMTQVAEGVRTAGLVMELAARHQVEMPICGQINGVVTGRLTVADAFRGLLRVRPGHENEPY
jgi:glycerol-3-phosphate dehydrogenase (NAD(P)+)